MLKQSKKGKSFMKKIFKKLIASVMSVCICTTAFVSTASAVTGTGTYSYNGYSAYSTKFESAIDQNYPIYKTLDGYTNVFKRYLTSNVYQKFVSTHAFLFSGCTNQTIFQATPLTHPASSQLTTIGSGNKIVVSVGANYYLSGNTAIETDEDDNSSSTGKYKEIYSSSISTSSAITANGTMEYRNPTYTLHYYFEVANY